MARSAKEKPVLTWLADLHVEQIGIPCIHSAATRFYQYSVSSHAEHAEHAEPRSELYGSDDGAFAALREAKRSEGLRVEGSRGPRRLTTLSEFQARV